MDINENKSHHTWNRYIEQFIYTKYFVFKTRY